jgi:L-asparagine transporter-like permease
MKFNTPGNYNFEGFGKLLIEMFLLIILILFLLMDIKLTIILIIFLFIIFFIIGCIFDKKDKKH